MAFPAPPPPPETSTDRLDFGDGVYWTTTQSTLIEFRSVRREECTFVEWWSRKLQARVNQVLDRTRWRLTTDWRLWRRP